MSVLAQLTETNCPVCFEDFTEDNYRIICGNEHALCGECLEEHKKPRRAEFDYGQGQTFSAQISITCPICRDPMFDWDEGQESEEEVFAPEQGSPEDLRRRNPHTQDLAEINQQENDLLRQLADLRIRQGQIAQQSREWNVREQGQARSVATNVAFLSQIRASPPQGQSQRRRRRRRRRGNSNSNSAPRCGICREQGHNRRTCPQR